MLFRQAPRPPRHDKAVLLEKKKMLPFLDRADAGRRLASRLEAYSGQPEVVILGLTRGGIPVAFEIARRLGALLDVVVVRKLGAPWQPELAMGALASGGIRILNQALIRSLNLSNYFVYGTIAKRKKRSNDAKRSFAMGVPRYSSRVERLFSLTMVPRPA